MVSSHTIKTISHFYRYCTQKRAFLEIELAAVVDWGRPFVTATYSLEGDGPLIVSGYDIVETTYKVCYLCV